MANHEAVAAFPVAPGTANKQLARDMAVRRMPYWIDLESEMASLVAVDPASGAAIQDILLNGRVYHYNVGDQGGAHDGTTILVSFEGRRYKLAAQTDVVAYAVISKTLTDPPPLPANGDAYLVAPGGINAWSGKDNQVAIKTARGWEFVNFSIGRMLYVQNTDSYWHKNASGVWTIGFGSQSLAANTVAPSAIIGRPVRWLVLNMTTTTPPPSPTPGQAYIISSSPSGPWLSHPGKIAIYESGPDFTIYTPRVGETAFNQDATPGVFGGLAEVRFNGTAWLPAAAAYQLIMTQNLPGSTIDVIFPPAVTSGNDYDSYELVISGLKVSAAGVLQMQVGTGSPTVTWLATTPPGYLWSWRAITNLQDASNSVASLSGSLKQNPGTFIIITPNTTNDWLSAAAGCNYGARINFDNPQLGDFLNFNYHARFNSAAGNVNVEFSGSGRHVTAGPFTGLRIFPSAGTITAHRTSLYGRRKS